MDVLFVMREEVLETKRNFCSIDFKCGLVCFCNEPIPEDVVAFEVQYATKSGRAIVVRPTQIKKERLEQEILGPKKKEPWERIFDKGVPYPGWVRGPEVVAPIVPPVEGANYVLVDHAGLLESPVQVVHVDGPRTYVLWLNENLEPAQGTLTVPGKATKASAILDPNRKAVLYEMEKDRRNQDLLPPVLLTVEL